MALREENNELREEIGKLLESNKQLSEELDEISKTVVKMQVAMQQGEGEKKKSRFDRLVDKVKESKDVAELQAENEVLSAQLALRQSEAARLHAMELNTKHLQAFIRDTQVELQETKEELKALRTNPDSLLGPLTAERDSLSSELVELKQTLQDTQAEHARKIQELEAKHEEALALDRRMQTRTMNAQDSKVGKLRDINDELTGKLEAAMRTIDEEKAKSEKLKEDLDQKILDCKAWKDQCEHMGSELIRHEDTENDVRVATQSLAELEVECKVEREKRVKAEKQVSEMRAQMERLSSALGEHQLRHDEVENLRKTIKSQTAQIASLKESIRLQDDTMKNNQLGYDNMKKDLQSALKVVAERDALLEEARARRREETRVMANSIVADLIHGAALHSEWAKACKCAELEDELRDREEETEALREEVQKLAQKLGDVEGEHKIRLRKKENLIKELQSSLRSNRSTNHHNLSGNLPALDDLSQGTMTPERRCLMAPSPSASSFQDPLSLSVGSGQELNILHKEEAALIHRVAALKEANWKLEEEKRNLNVSIKYLQEDNEKKGLIISHWLSGPAAEMLLKNRAKLSTPSQKSGTWLSSIVPGTGSQNTTMQGLIQDTLAENIKLHRKIEELTKRTS
eukprot:TRINITY_DN33534_c0_g1_i1.p1 TRINITY_DN33534_c0_g1~~TRINITY_DN33534_c0_g1_i1.p1  ORF type:complete len:633 (+),score=272.99 TRINITY_DN33534_c0_g1_i1:38-1936(+)